MSLKQVISPTRRSGPVFSIKGHSCGFQGEEPEPGLPLELMLQKLEAAGVTPQELPVALMDGFQIHFPEFRGLSCGFPHREQPSPRDPKMGLWVLTVFKNGWRVLDHLGTTPGDLLAFLLRRWPPRAWRGEQDLLRIPPAFRHHLEPDQLAFGPQDHPRHG